HRAGAEGEVMQEPVPTTSATAARLWPALAATQRASQHPRAGTFDVKRNGRPGSAATRQSNLSHRLILRNARLAGVAHFPVAWAAPNPCDALIWQTTVLELVPDEEQEDLQVHVASRVSRANGTTPDSPGSRRPNVNP